MKKQIKKIVFISTFSLLLILGFWQVQRYIYKLNVISQIRASQTETPKYALNANEVTKTQYKKIRLVGKFINQKPIYYYALKNNTPGYEIIVPFELENSKEYILVNAGWSPSKRIPKILGKRTEISGYAINLPRKRIISFQNDLTKNLWFDLSPNDLSKHLGKTIYPTLVLLESKEYLIGEAISFKLDQITNNHGGYALVWFSLAFSLIVMLKFMRKSKTRDKKKK